MGSAEKKPPFLLDLIVSEKVVEGGVGEYYSASLKDVLKRTYMEKSKLLYVLIQETERKNLQRLINR